ncbi:hypothetical protein QWY79_02645 [Halomonas sabkhae]|uniref:hypothetical protein n=1 Tax=Halomonas sabkhae TaxID=626223 RepID=UPI0025B45D0D|nr:hypothetical protein [Halomonas sabkhae]MDN3524161.1 hypothetical protein [Halomonas sabkhae]
MKRWLRPLLSRFARSLLKVPYARRLGQRVLAPFPGLRGRVIRLIHGGHLEPMGSNPVDGRGEGQQRLIEDLEQRWNHPS